MKFLLVILLAATGFTACVPGFLLVPAEARPGVSRLMADGANVQSFTVAEKGWYHTNGNIDIADWTTGQVRIFEILHEVCHAWQASRGIGLNNWPMTPEGTEAVALGMDLESSADTCALHYMGTDTISYTLREPGYYLGTVSNSWLDWANRWLP